MLYLYICAPVCCTLDTIKGIWKCTFDNKQTSTRYTRSRIQRGERVARYTKSLVEAISALALNLKALINHSASESSWRLLGKFWCDARQIDNRQQFPSRPPSPLSSVYGGRSQTPSINSGHSSWHFSPNSSRSTSLYPSQRSSSETEDLDYTPQTDNNSNAYVVPPAYHDRNSTIRPSQQKQPQFYRAMSHSMQDPRSSFSRSEEPTRASTRSLTPPIVESPSRKGSMGPPPSLRSTLDKKATVLKMRIA